MTATAEQTERAKQQARYADQAYKASGRAYSHIETKEKYQRRLNRLKSLRRPIEYKWRQVRDLLDPAATKYLDDDGADPNYDDSGIVDDSRILDSTPRKMAQTAADGLHGGLTSPLVKWFSFYSGDYSSFDMTATHAEKEWLNIAEECVRDTLSNSNFYLSVHPFHKEIFEFGTSLLMAYSNANTIVRFFHYTVGSFWLAQNADREVDTVCTKTMVSAIDIATTYGWNNIPKVVKDKIEVDGDQDYRFAVIQVVQPWNFFGDAGANPNDFKYEDIHFLEDGDTTDSIMYRDGFLTKPFIVGRWYEAWDAIYPKTCPGIDALPDIRQLYQATEQFNAAIEWAANPAWAIDAQLMADVETIRPGQLINVQGASTRDPVRPLIPAAFDLNGNINKRAALIESISGTFYNREIMMVSSRAQSNHVMTATEVDQLRQEKNAVMGPINTRQSNPNKEVLDRVYELITTDWQILDAPPDSLIGQQVKPYFTSDMAIAQRQQWIQRANDVIAWMQAVQNAYPQIRHTFDFDRWAREFEKTDTVPSFVFRSPEEVERIIQQENQAASQQAEAQQMAVMAKAGKDLGQTPTTGDNAAAEVMTEMQNAQG